MTPNPEHLKLGKGVGFVKTQLRRLRQEEDAWEADFSTIAKRKGPRAREWMGLVIDRPYGAVLATRFVEAPPSVNDMADLLADAMRRPSTGHAHRPRILYLRPRPLWQELLPHLKAVGIEVKTREALSVWDKAIAKFSRQPQAASKHAPSLPLNWTRRSRASRRSSVPTVCPCPRTCGARSPSTPGRC